MGTFDSTTVIGGLGLGMVVSTAFFLLVSNLLRSRTRVSSEARHQIWLATLGTLCLASIASVVWLSSVAVTPGFAYGDFPTSAAQKFQQSGDAIHPVLSDPGPTVAWCELLLWVWLVVVATLLLRLCVRLVAARRLVAASTEIDAGPWREALLAVCDELGIQRAPRLYRHPDIRSPMLGGLLRQRLVLPDDFVAGDPRAHSERVRMAFLHELAHAQRRDPLWQLVGELAWAAHFFHPCAHVLRRRLEEAQEMASDSRVLEAGVKPSSYATFLIDVWRDGVRRRTPNPSSHLAAVCPIASVSPLESRVRAVLDDTHPRPKRSRLVTTVNVALALACLASLGLAQRRANRAVGDTLDRAIRTDLVNRMARHGIAGSAISIVKDGKLVYQRGFGFADVFEQRTIDPTRSIFRIGSISKAVTGIAVLQCVDAGLLKLDADVNDYLRDFQIDKGPGGPVRVKHLLTHTGGFDQLGYGRHIGSRDQVRPLGEFLREHLVRVRPAGQLTCYDTYGITLAGYLVEVVSGMPFDRYLKKKIFEPLGMSRSGIVVPDTLRDDVVRGYSFDEGFVAQGWEFMNTDPASTINSTVSDMAKLMTMLLGKGLYEGRRVLSEKSTKAMFTRQFSNHPDLPGYSYTLFEDFAHGVPGFHHGGSMAGFGTFLYLVPRERLGIFVACNQESNRLAGAAVSAAIGHFVKDRAPRPKLRPRTKDVDLTRYVGPYFHNLYNHSRPERGGWRPRRTPITQSEDGALVYRERKFFPVGAHTFQREDGELMIFRVDDVGKVTEMLIEQSVFERQHRGR